MLVSLKKCISYLFGVQEYLLIDRRNLEVLAKKRVGGTTKISNHMIHIS